MKRRLAVQMISNSSILNAAGEKKTLSTHDMQFVYP